MLEKVVLSIYCVFFAAELQEVENFYTVRYLGNSVPYSP